MDEARRTEIMRQFAAYSFRDAPDWDGLTPTEQKFCTREEFTELRAWALPEGQ